MTPCWSGQKPQKQRSEAWPNTRIRPPPLWQHGRVWSKHTAPTASLHLDSATYPGRSLGYTRSTAWHKGPLRTQEEGVYRNKYICTRTGSWLPLSPHIYLPGIFAKTLVPVRRTSPGIHLIPAASLREAEHRETSSLPRHRRMGTEKMPGARWQHCPLTGEGEGFYVAQVPCYSDLRQEEHKGKAPVTWQCGEIRLLQREDERRAGLVPFLTQPNGQGFAGRSLKHFCNQSQPVP